MSVLTFPCYSRKHADTFICRYLSDTLHAAEKIRALVKQAVHEQGNPAGTVLKYQLALSLVPYASDSVEVLSRLYAEFSSWLFNAGAFRQAIQYGKSAVTLAAKLLRTVTRPVTWHSSYLKFFLLQFIKEEPMQRPIRGWWIMEESLRSL